MIKLNVQEAAKIIGRSPQFVRQRVATRTITISVQQFEANGKRWVYDIVESKVYEYKGLEVKTNET